MGVRVNVCTAARLTGRSEKTIRRWLAEEPCPLAVLLGPSAGGRKETPGRTRYVDADELRALHEARGGVAWHADYLPEADLPALRAELAALARRVVRLENQAALRSGSTADC